MIPLLKESYANILTDSDAKVKAIAAQPGEWKMQEGLIPIKLHYPTVIGRRHPYYPALLSFLKKR